VVGPHRLQALPPCHALQQQRLHGAQLLLQRGHQQRRVHDRQAGAGRGVHYHIEAQRQCDRLLLLLPV
jgi:hypothetical protein